jgi:ATP-dependent Zn protease
MIALVLVLVFSWVMNAVEKSQYRETTIADFWTAMEQNQLAEVEIKGDRILYMTKEEMAKDPSSQKACFTGLPHGGDILSLSRELKAMGIDVNYRNRLMHGLMPIPDMYNQGIYLFWLCLKMYFKDSMINE